MRVNFQVQGRARHPAVQGGQLHQRPRGPRGPHHRVGAAGGRGRVHGQGGQQAGRHRGEGDGRGRGEGAQAHVPRAAAAPEGRRGIPRAHGGQGRRPPAARAHLVRTTRMQGRQPSAQRNMCAHVAYLAAGCHTAEQTKLGFYEKVNFRKSVEKIFSEVTL